MEKKNFGEVSKAKCFGGQVIQYEHFSETLQCNMVFSIYWPSTTTKSKLLYFLSGLTCTDQNFITKANVFPYANKHQFVIVAPDTSPRGSHVATSENNAWDLGLGAGFYVNATQDPWKTNYQMYSYIVEELPRLLKSKFSDQIDFEQSHICGHSMGGLGALQIYLKNTNVYKSCSAFAPICHPSHPDCQWGQKAFSNYLGKDNKSLHEQYDPTLLLEKASNPSDLKIKITVGSADKFLPQNQLLPEFFVEKAQKLSVPLEYQMAEGYDHSYYFIATFLEEHVAFHAKH